MRNQNSRFALNPTNIDISRSTFKRNHSLKTSFNVGDIVPIMVDEVLPGDTFNVKTNKLIRMQTLVAPIMDNVYMDTYYFFVPNRILWEHWKEFHGENNDSEWAQEIEYEALEIEHTLTKLSDDQIAYIKQEFIDKHFIHDSYQNLS